MKQEYRFVRTSISGRTVDHIVRATKAIFEDDALVVEAENQGGGGSRAATYLRRDDAIDLAWRILEHYGVAEQPDDPLTVGDFVVTNGGHIGRVVDIDLDEPALYVEGPSTSPNWKYTDDTHRITKEEFVEKYLAKATEEINTFMGED